MPDTRKENKAPLFEIDGLVPFDKSVCSAPFNTHLGHIFQIDADLLSDRLHQRQPLNCSSFLFGTKHTRQSLQSFPFPSTDMLFFSFRSFIRQNSFGLQRHHAVSGSRSIQGLQKNSLNKQYNSFLIYKKRLTQAEQRHECKYFSE